MDKKKDQDKIIVSMKLSKDAEFSNYTTKSSTSDTGSLKESDRKKWRQQEILLLEDKFPTAKSLLKQKQFRTNPSTPKIQKRKSNQLQLLMDWQILNATVEEKQQEENILESKSVKQSKLKMVRDDEEFNTKSRNRFQGEMSQWQQRCKSLEALPQVEEEDLLQPEESLTISKKIQAFMDKNEFNEFNGSLNQTIGSNIQINNQNLQLCIPSIQEDDEFKQESPTHQKTSIIKTLETKLQAYKLKIDELDQKKKTLIVPENQLEILEEAKEEEDEILNKIPELELLTKLRSEEKEFLKRIIRGEQLTSVDQLFEFLEKEPMKATTPIEELQEEDEACKKDS